MKEPTTPLKLLTPLRLSPDTGCLNSVIPLWLMEIFHWEKWSHDLSLTFACQFGPFSNSFLNFCDCNFAFLPLYLSGMHYWAMLRVLCIGQEIHIHATGTMQYNGVSLVNEKLVAAKQSQQQQRRSELPNFIVIKIIQQGFSKIWNQVLP